MSKLYCTVLVIPRQARLDVPDTLHHVMVRGWERRPIFRDEADRVDFVALLAPPPANCCGVRVAGS